jgi:hypothetical protein
VTREEMAELFDRYSNEHSEGGSEYLEFDRVEDKLHPRPDIAAFLLLDRLCPSPGCNMVRDAEHDQFFLNIDADKLAVVIAEQDIVTLIRCGVLLDSGIDVLCMNC